MKKIVIISASLRVNSNSDILARECEKGAILAGNDVKYISLKDKDIKFCKGCLACQVNHKCVIKDDVETIMNDVKDADVLVFATPIYYYEMAGQLKTLLDRLNPLYGTDYKFRDVYMISTAADDQDYTFDRAYNGLDGWVECFPNAKLKGIVKGFGISEPNKALSNKKILKEALSLGESL